mmetsp:Transcript_9410/g.20822  ORF Transcript_9410/g.20822 Transcript_9410/m.20822 type:complete len:132 (+) Transcript_9410:814-1209(+)
MISQGSINPDRAWAVPKLACREPRRFNEAELTGDEVVVLEVSGDGEAVKRFFSTPDSVALFLLLTERLERRPDSELDGLGLAGGLGCWMELRRIACLPRLGLRLLAFIMSIPSPSESLMSSMSMSKASKDS